MKPNLFDNAPKELSQDAFFIWLILYFNCHKSDSVTADDLELKKCSTAFLNSLLRFQVSTPFEIVSVKAGRQWKNIDIYIEVETRDNKKYLIVIESKTFTSYHSDQLARYKKEAEEWCDQNGYMKPVCIYLKTGNESRYSLMTVTQNNFHIVSRNNILSILETYPSISNSIFTDFKSRLQRLDASYKLYRSKAVGKWNEIDWQGLFLELDRRNAIMNWGFVNNASGGFWNAVIDWPIWKGFPVHYQIEQGRLCFKICFDPEETENTNFDANQMHEEWQRILLESKNNDFPVERPYPFVRRGMYRTAAIIPKEKWLGNDHELINLEKVISNIKNYQKHLTQAIVSNSH